MRLVSSRIISASEPNDKTKFFRGYTYREGNCTVGVYFSQDYLEGGYAKVKVVKP